MENKPTRPAGTHSLADFDASYAGVPPWDTGRPQPAFAALAAEGALSGRVLDVGCGTGEHALLAAGLGLEAVGVDAAHAAIAQAQTKARDRSLNARFVVADVFDPGALAGQFDTVVDSGLFHVFNDEDRRRYVHRLAALLPPGGRCFLLCFSNRQPGDFGPRRISPDEIRAGFAEGWRVDSIEPARFEIRVAPGAAIAWLARLTRA